MGYAAVKPIVLAPPSQHAAEQDMSPVQVDCKWADSFMSFAKFSMSSPRAAWLRLLSCPPGLTTPGLGSSIHCWRLALERVVRKFQDETWETKRR